MSTNRFHDLSTVCAGSYKWKIKVRVVRFWRGQTKTGDLFKSFNLLLLDDKNCRMHAFVPGFIADQKEEEIKVGNIYIISNFSVKDYKEHERFRPVRNENQIIFTNYTKIVEVHDNDTLIQHNDFDFFDLSELEEIGKQNVYLTDVLGIMQCDVPLRHLVNCNNKDQVQLKFNITDGRSLVGVTFWDSVAEDLHNQLQQDLQEPIIIIIASARITNWEGKVEVGCVSATKFYLNYHHHSVVQMRQMLASPVFSNTEFSSQHSEKIKQLNVGDILELGAEYINKEVICDVKIWGVDATPAWFFSSCTSCYREIEMVNGLYECVKCDRVVPDPLKKFRLMVDAYDETGELNITIEDREVRSLIGYSVNDLKEQLLDIENFPPKLKSLEDKDCSIKLLIKKGNIDKTIASYLAKDIYERATLLEDAPMEDSTEFNENVDTLSQASGSNYHLDGISQLSFVTPKVTLKTKMTNKKS